MNVEECKERLFTYFQSKERVLLLLPFFPIVIGQAIKLMLISRLDDDDESRSSLDVIFHPNSQI